MAEDKKGFILYADLLGIVEKFILKDRKDGTNYAGELFYHILLYVNDKNPIPINFIIDMAFEPIKHQLKRDLRKYEKVKATKTESGALGNIKRWHKDLYDKIGKGEIDLTEALEIAKHRTVSHRVANIAVNVNDNVTVINKIDKEKEIFSSPSWIENICMTYKLKKAFVTEKLKEFVAAQKLMSGWDKKTLDDLKDHFVNTIKKTESTPEAGPKQGGTGGKSFA